LILSIVLLTKTNPGAHPTGGPGGIGGFLITAGAAFGYAAGWTPYASDYSRYLPKQTSKLATGASAGLGVFLSCVVLEIVGAASVTAGGTSETNPTGAFTGQLPHVLGDLTLLAIALGAVSANVLNVYSGAMSFLTVGIRLPLALRRAIAALGFGTIGFFVAWSGLSDAGTKYTNFLLLIAYWIGPWLGVFFTDQLLRWGRRVDDLLYAKWYQNWAGLVAMLVSIGLSVWLFSNQTEYTGVVPSHVPAVGDITFLVGFVLAGTLYAVLRPFLGARRSAPNQPESPKLESPAE
jgi:purine-cytosine permease-like protein